MTSVLPAIILTMALLGVVFLIAGIKALTRRRLFGAAVNTTLALLLLASAALAGLLAVATQGYRALTHEEVAAVVYTEPVGPDRFKARFVFPGGREAAFELAGDQLYVDANILKWKPIANFLGFHTVYQLDRVAGRYSELGEEQTLMRTVVSVSEDRPLNLFELRQRYRWLSPLLDVDYGSGTFVAADGPASYELRVSTTGLLIRPLINSETVP